MLEGRARRAYYRQNMARMRSGESEEKTSKHRASNRLCTALKRAGKTEVKTSEHS